MLLIKDLVTEEGSGSGDLSLSQKFNVILVYIAASKLAQAMRFYLTETILEFHRFLSKDDSLNWPPGEVSAIVFTPKKKMSLNRSCMNQISLKYNFSPDTFFMIENIKKIIIKILSIYSSNK